MLNEDQYLDRTPDLVAKVRKMREAAEKEMNRFTCIADYDVRRVVGQKPKQPPQAPAESAPVEAAGKLRRSAAQLDARQLVLEIPPAHAECSNDAEGV